MLSSLSLSVNTSTTPSTFNTLPCKISLTWFFSTYPDPGKYYRSHLIQTRTMTSPLRSLSLSFFAFADRTASTCASRLFFCLPRMELTMPWKSASSFSCTATKFRPSWNTAPKGYQIRRTLSRLAAHHRASSRPSSHLLASLQDERASRVKA